MKKIKRVLFLFVAAFMLLVTLASCGSKKPSPIGSYGNGLIVITEKEVTYPKSNNEHAHFQYRVVDSTFIFVYDHKSIVSEVENGKFVYRYTEYTEEEMDNRVSPYGAYYITDAGDLMVLNTYSTIRRDK